MLAPVARQFRVVGVDEIVVAPHRLAGRGRIEPAENIEQRRFAGARRPQQHDEFALVDVEVDVAKRMHRDLAHDIDLRQPARAEHYDPAGRSTAAAWLVTYKFFNLYSFRQFGRKSLIWIINYCRDDTQISVLQASAPRRGRISRQCLGLAP